MGTNWFRSQARITSYSLGSSWMCAIANGSTYRRVRWSWGFAGVTADVVDISGIIANPLTVGLVTTFGNGTETPPNPVTASGDAAPPTLRWLWWEQRQPIPIAVDHNAGIITWRDSGAQEIPDVKSQVLATGAPAGDTLNLWFSIASATGGSWDASGSVRIWVATSVLFTTP